MSKKQLMVAALKNGTVIDHIPSSKLFQVVSLLHLEQMKTAVTVGYNLESEEMGRKSIIKVADKFFTDEELNQLSVVTPNVTLCIIKDYEVVEKKTVTMPSVLRGIVHCTNPKCITNHEPMRTLFHSNGNMLSCHYCNHSINLDEVEICK